MKERLSSSYRWSYTFAAIRFSLYRLYLWYLIKAFYFRLKNIMLKIRDLYPWSIKNCQKGNTYFKYILSYCWLFALSENGSYSYVLLYLLEYKEKSVGKKENI